MSGLDAREVARLARLARLDVGAGEEVALAREVAEIVASFGSLAAFAEALPPAPEPEALPLRADEPHPPSADLVGGILAAAPDVDASGAIRTRRGPP